MTRICKTCKENKPLKAFKGTKCKSCRQDYMKKYYQRNKEKALKDSKLRYLKNSARVKEQVKAYRANNKESIALAKKRYYEENKEKILLRDSAYYRAHKDKILKRKRKYHSQKKSDPNYFLAKNLRSRLNVALRKNYKTGSAVRDLGCSIQDLRKHLEIQFQPGMTWENYGEWHIDHIIPLVNFDLTDKKQLKEACHYTNLQPLWAIDNLRKGGK